MMLERNMTNLHSTIGARAIILMLFFFVVIPFLPLLISRRWDWWEAWLFGFICVLNFAVSRALAARRHPDLLAERARAVQHKDAQPWDRLLAPLAFLPAAFLAVALVIRTELEDRTLRDGLEGYRDYAAQLKAVM